MPTFDLNAAREAGHSDEEIVTFLSDKLKFDRQAAEKAGYSTSDILSGLLSKVDTAAAPTPPPAPRVEPGETGPGGEMPPPPAWGIVKQFVKEQGLSFVEHRLKPLAAMGNAPRTLGMSLSQYVMTNGLDEALATAASPEEAIKETVRKNTTDVLLSAFDVGTLAAGGPLHGILRETAAKIGVKPALEVVFASAAEAGGYLGIYNGLEAVMEGHSAGEVGRKMAEGAAIGTALGGVTGAIGGAVATQLNKRAMIRAAKENVAGQQLFEDAKRTLGEQYPHLTPRQVEANARKIAFEGRPIEKLGLPEPPATPKGASHTEFSPDAGTALAFDQAIEDLSRPVIPPVVIEERARRIPFFGPEKLRPFIRAEAQGPGKTIREHFADIRNGFASLYSAEPGATNEVKSLFFQARAALGSAPDRANQTIYHYIFEPLGKGKDVGEKTAHLSDYLVAMDRTATMRPRSTFTVPTEETFIPGIGKVSVLGESVEQVGRPLPGPMGTTFKEWSEAADALAAKVSQHPELVQAGKAVRFLLDEMHQTMAEYGMIEPSRMLDEYFPAQRLYEIAHGLAQDMQGTAIGGELAATLKRNSAGDIIQTNIVRVLQKSLTALNRKVAEIELWRAIENNPRLNVTDLFQPGESIPKGFKLYRPGPGMPGYRADDVIEEALNGAIAGLRVPETHHTPGAFVLPEDLANRLQHFYERSGSPVERAVYRAANMFARQLTIYNLSNTSLNQGSDFFLAQLGLQGERSNMFGFLRFLPSSIKAAYRGAFGRESALYERASREGIAGGTFIRSVGGEPVSGQLAPAILQGRQPNVLTRMHDFYDNLVRLRQAVEATPRIAAGQAAEARSGVASDFARVGREITLPYGAGDPRISRVPLMRLLATFWRFQGMASSRIFRLATTRGSRARGIAAITAPSVGAALWNLQNKDFRQVEYSLGQYDRNHLHFIIPDPDDPSKPYRKPNGSPMVFRARFWVPEEIAGLYGLGNLPTRLVDVGTGYTSPGQFAGEVGSEVAGNVASLAAPLLTAQQALTGRSSLTGQPLEAFERTETTLPAFYHFGKFFETLHNEGLAPALAQAPLRMMGIREAGAKRGQADAKLLRLRAQLRDAQARLRAAGAKGDKFRIEHYRKKIDRLARQLQEAQAGRQTLEQTVGQ